MRYLKSTLWTVLLAGCISCASASSTETKVDLKSTTNKVSYSIGVDIGKHLTGQGINLNTEVFAQGIRDGIENSSLQMTEEEMQETLRAFQQSLMEEREAENKRLSEQNLQLGQDFLASNSKKTGVQTLPSGLQYEVIVEGTGETPTVNDTVTTHYRGTLIDGTVFDSSYDRGQPATFPVQGVIPGWTEALQLMKTGSKWKLYIPSKLAYGEQRAGEVIGPNSTLVFEVELLSIDSESSSSNG